MSMRHDVLFVVATRIKFMCPMNYAKFPMDKQTCKFQVRIDGGEGGGRSVFRT